jgi:hypothetical protein
MNDEFAVNEEFAENAELGTDPELGTNLNRPKNFGYEHSEPSSAVIPVCPECGGAMQLLGLERWVGWRCVPCSERAAAVLPS